MGVGIIIDIHSCICMDIGQIIFAKLLTIVIVLWLMWGFVIVGVGLKNLRREITKKNRKKK